MRNLSRRLAVMESRPRPMPNPLDLSMLTDHELETLTSLPHDPTALTALIESPEFDWMPLARIFDRLGWSSLHRALSV